MSVIGSLNNEEESKNKPKNNSRERKTKGGIGSKRKRSLKNVKNKNSVKSNSVSKKAKTKDKVIVEDYNFQDPKLEAKFFSFLYSFEDLQVLSRLKNVGAFNRTMKSLVFGLFWFYRMSNVGENRYCLRRKPLMFQKYEDFKQSIRKIRSLAPLTR
jgi:hypothetical protein